MPIKDFKVEKWLNPLCPECKFNLGSSCVKPIAIEELLDIAGADKNEFIDHILKTPMHYGSFFGLPRLLSAIAGTYRKAQPGMILTFHGGTGANSSIITGLLEKGDNVVAVMPNYQQHYSIPEALGNEVRYLHLDKESGFKIDAAQLDRLVDKNTKLITLTNPNNPTGAYINAEDWQPVIEIARKNGSYILSDEIYRGLSDDYMPSIIDLYEKGIASCSMSKVYSMSGSRVGWAVVPEKKAYEILLNRRSYDTICEGIFDEYVAAIALENNDKMLARARKIVSEHKKIVLDWLKMQPHLSYYCDSFTSTMLIYFDYDVDTVTFSKDVYDKACVLLCHGDCFEEKKCFRLGYGYDDEDQLKASLKAFGDYLNGLNNR